MAAEAFRDGRAAARLGGAAIRLAEERVFPSFRLYARTIYDVAGLASALTKGRAARQDPAAEIETVAAIDHNLALLFWVVAAAGMAGYSLSLGASLWTNTDRKPASRRSCACSGFAAAARKCRGMRKQLDRPAARSAANMRLMTCSRSRYTNTALSYPRTAVKSA